MQARFPLLCSDDSQAGGRLRVQVFVAYKEGQNFQGALAEMLDLGAAGASPGAIMQALVDLISTCSALMEGSMEPCGPEVRVLLLLQEQYMRGSPLAPG